MNWPMAKTPEGCGKGSRGNKIPTNPRDVRIRDGSVLAPAHACSKSYRDVALASGSGSSGSGLGRSLPQVSLPGQAGPGPEGPIKTSVADIKLNPNRPIDADDNAWPAARIDEASRRIAAYHRHGSQDERYNIHGPDGYVRVAVFMQLPEMKRMLVSISVWSSSFLRATARGL